jgi:hypothetical protein
MDAEQCVETLGFLHETGRVIHIAGGEAMLYWDILSESVRISHREEKSPHFIETNCSFAGDETVVRERLEFLAAHGVRGLLASADPYHQEFVPAEKFLRVRRIAKEIFGEHNFWGPNVSDEEIRALEPITADEETLKNHVRAHPPCIVGSAQSELAHLLDRYPPDDERLPAWGWTGLTEDFHCLQQFRSDTMWELHIDPYRNIQTNCGMILGILPETTPAGLLADGPEKANRFVEAVCEYGALGLAELARREYGFTLPSKVSQNCELCYLTRTFLRQFHPEVFGPKEVYG